MVGHLFGYEAALAIDASAMPLREARGHRAGGQRRRQRRRRAATSAAEIGRPAEQYVDGLRNARYDGHLEASTAVRLAGLLRDVLSDHPVEEYQSESGKVGSPAACSTTSSVPLTRAIEELTRPIDAIKHQAKTVTVGISRSDEGVIDRPLVQAVLAAGAGRDVLSYRTLKVLADLDPAVAEVVGFTRYGIDGGRRSPSSIAADVDRAGQPCRAATRARRHQAQRRHAARGARRPRAQRRPDGDLRARGQGQRGVGITLLHVRFHDRLDAATMRGVLQGYDRRYDRLVDWVSETEGAFDDRLLGELPVADLLIEPISDAAALAHWRTFPRRPPSVGSVERCEQVAGCQHRHR